MPHPRPFRRNHRAMMPGPNAGYSSRAYKLDPGYATAPRKYIRAYLLIQSDLEKLFEYIEPSPEAENAYSFRIHELLMRTCIEIEANLKAILVDNTYTPRPNGFGEPIYNMPVYRLIDKTHHLSSYQISLPMWDGPTRVVTPYDAWKQGKSPDWYKAYNASKHDRHVEFKKASLLHLIDAVSGLNVLISSQFGSVQFGHGDTMLSIGDEVNDGMTSTIGSLFRIKYPADWTDDEKYDFNWQVLSQEAHRIEKIDYDNI